MSNSKKPVRETPVRSLGESEWNADFYRRYSLDGESLEDCKARVTKEMRASRKAAIRLLSESDKPTSVFAGSVAMNNEVDFMLSINKDQIYGDTHFAIHQPKKRPEGLQGVQLKQQPKNVFVQLGNGATYWAANHHHAQTIHCVITAETKQMYAKCYKTWKDNV